jgi:hypothetical protein
VVRITPFRLRRLVEVRIALLLTRIPPLRPRLVARFAADLRRLNDAVSGTEIDGYYWVWSGLLLGWAREGAILKHDCLDADFGVDDRNFDRLLRTVPTLVAAGFRPDRRFVNNAGEVTELTLMRHGARFEFFRMFPVGDSLRYFSYNITMKGVTEMEACVPDQGTVPFQFLGRTWLKHEDHDLELRSIYGTWEIPDESWSYLDDLAVVACRSSRFSHFDWRPDAKGSWGIPGGRWRRGKGAVAR